LDIHGKAGTVFVNYENSETTVIAGTGKQSTVFTDDEEPLIDTDCIVKAVTAGIAKCVSLKRKHVTVKVPAEMENIVVLAAMKAVYSFDEYKSKKSHVIEHIDFYFYDGTTGKNDDLIVVNRCLAESIELTKTLQNQNASFMNPTTLEEECGNLAEHAAVEMKVLLFRVIKYI